MSSAGFLEVPAVSDDAQRLFDEDLAEIGYVMNVSTLWAHDVSLMEGLFDLLGKANERLGLSTRQRAVLTTACASTLGDSYCSLQWGCKLATAADPGLASDVLRGNDDDLTPAEQVLARWARRVAADPNRTVRQDVQELRDVGYDDGEILAITFFVALRLAFSTVNDALGVRPDAQLRANAPQAVLAAVSFGRPIADDI